MANDGQQYADWSTGNFYRDLPSNVSQDSFPSQPRLHERQMNNARHAKPASRAMDGWNSINVHRSPNLGLDGEYPTSLGPGESYNNFRLSVAAQPSSYTVQVPSHMPSHMPYEVSPDPISRFQNYPGPWVPQGIADIPGYPDRRPRESRSSNLRTRYSEPNASSFSQYQAKAGSELESDTTGPYPSDSGYGTRSQATTSILSSDPREYNQECSSITDHIDDLTFYPEDNFQAYPQPDKQARVQRNVHRPDPDQSQSANLQCPYADCGLTVKCQSEMTKHIRRHVKPFKCDQPGCDRMQEGFSTTNDLDRHKKSRHHIAPKHGHDRSFRCPEANCSPKDKIWPRLDNFRQHLKRKHNLEATDEVIAKAEQGAQALKNYNRLQAQCLEFGPSSGYNPIGNSSDDLRGSPDFTSNSWDAVRGAMGHGEDSHARYSSSPSRVLEGFDGSMDISIDHDRLPVTRSGAQPRSPRFFSTTSAPLMRSVSRGSRSSDAASDHVRARSNSMREHSKTTSLPTILLDASGAQSIDTNPSSPGSVTSHPPLDQPSSTGQRRILNPNTTSPLLNTALADVTQAIISNIADCLKAGTLDEAQMQSMVQRRLVNLLVSQASSQRSTRSQSSNRSGTRGGQLSCNECNKSLARKCDLKKHKKRHSKPYGCTFPDCNKIFGSKNDWKRHENSQHFQLECWRCHEPDPSSKINQCAKIFYRREKFTQHLKQDHPKLSDDHINEEVKRTRIGRSGQEKFWCGFCVKIIDLERKGLEAWDERFNHVDDRHFKCGQLISEWVPIDGHGPKGSQSEDTAQERSPACGQDEEDDDDSGEAEPCQESPPTIPLDDVTVPKRKAAPVTSHAHPNKQARLEKPHNVREAHRYCVLKLGHMMESAPMVYVTGERQQDGTIILRSDAVQQVLEAPKKMEPGKIYVTRLPGRSRPSFVRKRVQAPNLRLGFSAGTEKLVVPYAPPRSRSVEATPREIPVVSAPVPPRLAIAPPPQQLQLEHAGVQSTAAPQQPVQYVHAAPSNAPPPLVLEQPQPSSTVTAQVVTHHGRRHDTILQHTCTSCGKFRSPSYHHRHPLGPNEIPKLGICRKCKKVETSSDESTEDESRSRSRSGKARHKRSTWREKYRDRHRRSSSEERPPSVEEVIRVTRRTESRGSRERRRNESRRRRHSPSSSEGQAQIQVSYAPARKNKVEPPPERVHVVERIKYIEAPGHGRSRSESRAREQYEEDDEYVRVRQPTQPRRPIKFISYRQDDDGHIIEEHRPEPTRAFSPRRQDPHLVQHEEVYHPRKLEYRHRPRRISYEQIREPSRSSRDSFEHGYHADIPSRPPSRSVRVLRVHDRGSEDVIRDSWESDSAEVEPPRVMFVSADYARRHSPVERHVEEELQPIRPRRRRRVRDLDDLVPNRRSELPHHSIEHTLPPRHYRDVRVPTPPSAQWRPQAQERYLSPPSPLPTYRARHDDLTHILERARLSPTTSPPPTRGRPHSRVRSLSRSRSASTYRPPSYRHVSGDGMEEDGKGEEPIRYVRLRESVTNPEDWDWGVGELPVREAAPWEGARWVRG